MATIASRRPADCLTRQSSGTREKESEHGNEKATSTGKNIEVNSVSLYVEEHGQGDPIVLIHPGLTSSAVYAGVVPLLAEQFRVITFDSRGHGRSTNPSGELSYELIADDAVALIEALGIERPCVGGWSDGGHAALEVGLRHAGRAKALIVGGAFADFQNESHQAKVREWFHVKADGMVDADAFARTHAQTVLPMMRQLQPLGEAQARTIVQQEATMLLTYSGLTPEQLSRIDTPALVVHADRDEIIELDAAIDLYRWLPNAELAILPGASHMRPVFDPATFVRVIVDFILRR